MSLPLRIDFDEKPVRIAIAAAAVAAIGLVAGAAWHSVHRKSAAAPIVYVCSETGETFRVLPQNVPAVNPKTGRRTLFRGVFCPDCDRWYAATVPSQRVGNPKPFYCPVHKKPLTSAGPADP